MIMCVILEKVQINTHTQTLRKQQHCVLYIYICKNWPRFGLKITFYNVILK